MSDLQCPARIFLAAGEVSDPALGGLAAERIASVLVPGTEPYVRTATGAADALSCRVEHRGDLEDPDGLVEALHELADAYRGEAVLVVADPDLVTETLRRLGAGEPGVTVEGSAADITVLEGDSDGWLARPWVAGPTG